MNGRSIADRLPTIFLFLGTLAVLVAGGVFLVLGQVDRYVIVLLAIGLGLWIYAALERPERTIAALGGRGVRYGSNTVLMSVAFLAILGLVNVLANRYSDRFDLTANHLYTLSPLSVQVVHELKQPVKVMAFYQTGETGRNSLEDLLKEYTRQSHLITYQFIDPVLKPGLARQYNVQTYGTTVLVSGSKSQTLTAADEGSITSALLKLERTKPEVVYYLTGHGELDFTSSAQNGGSSAKSALEADNYTLKPLNLASTGKVPSDASALIVAGPTSKLLPQEMTALESYINGGGKLLVMVDKQQQPILGAFAQKYGVDIGNGVIIDPAQSLMNDPLTPLINRYQFSPITKDLPMLIFQAATSVTPSPKPPTGWSVQPLAETTSQSWLETDPKVIHYDPGVDPKGPLDVAVTATKTTTAPATNGKTPPSPRIVFIGDVAYASNNLINLGGGDKALLTNSINWLTANEDLIQIQAKSPLNQNLILSNTQLNVMLYGSAVFLPLFVLGAGVLVWWRRR